MVPNITLIYCSVNQGRDTLLQKYTVWVETEYWRPGEWISNDDSSDVVVTWEDGSRWGAAFISYQHVKTLTEKNTPTAAPARSRATPTITRWAVVSSAN